MPFGGVCLPGGGDGICGLGWGQIENLMGFDPGLIGAKRGFSGSYSDGLLYGLIQSGKTSIITVAGQGG